MTLKKQVKDMKEELKARCEELDDIKKSTKFTKFKELEVR